MDCDTPLGAEMSEAARIHGTRGSLMVVAAMAAFVACLAGVRPHGGFWRDGPQAGQPIMLTEFPVSYARLRACCNMAMACSLLIILLLSSKRFYSTPIRMAMLQLIGLFDMICLMAVVVFSTSPEDPVGDFFAYVLPPVVVSVLILAAAYVCSILTRQWSCS